MKTIEIFKIMNVYFKEADKVDDFKTMELINNIQRDILKINTKPLKKEYCKPCTNHPLKQEYTTNCTCYLHSTCEHN